MKKIGIITSYKNYNYGSVLQAFALQNVIRELSYDAVIINYHKKAKYDYLLKLINYKNKILLCIRRPYLIKKIFQDHLIFLSLMSSQSDDVKRKFDTFIDEYCREYNDNYCRYATRDFYAFICGSDQIWNLDTVGLNPILFLRFAPEYMRIAYAPSFGAIHIPEYNRRRLKQYLSQIPSLSVRESTGIDIIRQCTGREVKRVLDPVLLAGKDFWNQFIDTRTKKEYIVCYFLGDASEAYPVIDNLQGYLKTDVIWINSSHKLEGRQYRQVEPDPLEYVSFIQNAVFVCTDSFHATVFSVMLGTPFFVFDRKYETGKEQEGTRIDSFLLLVRLQNRKYSVKNGKIDTVMNIDFEYAQQVLEEVQKGSLQYLTDSLKTTIDGYNSINDRKKSKAGDRA